MSVEGEDNQPTTKPADDNQAAAGCIMLVILLVVGGLLFKGCSMMAEHGKKLRAEDQRAQPAQQMEDTPSDTAVNAAARQAVLAKLSDPDSAKFRGVFVVSKPGRAKTVCGEVNAKNKMGGYAGFTRFISAGTPELTYFEADLADANEAWRELCSR